MAQETTFFSEGGITVTQARFITPGGMHAMSGILSVRSGSKSPSRVGPIILGVVGMIAMTQGSGGLILGLLLIAGAVFWWVSQKTKYPVVLRSGNGETNAYSNTDKSFIENLIKTLNDAIVHRG